MVYRGPRRGCDNCKKRKRKCDGGSPACAACIKRNEKCVGLEIGLDAVLRDESSKISQKVQRQNAAVVRSRSHSPVILVNPDYRELDAIYFFINTYGNPSRDPGVGRSYLDLLHPMFSNARRDSPVVHATSAISVFLQEAWSAMLPETDRTRKYLGKALNSVNRALADPLESMSDETLLAVLLLEMYEVIAMGLQSRPSPKAHQRGAIALVEHRGSLNFRSETSKKLLIAVRHEILADSNKRASAIDETSLIWSGSSPMPSNHGIELDLIRLEHVNLKSIIQPVFNRSHSIGQLSSPSVLTLDMFCTEARSLDARLSNWYNSLPEDWIPESVTEDAGIPQSVKASGMYGDSCDVYKDIHVANLLNSYRVTRVAVLTWIIQLSILRKQDEAAPSEDWTLWETTARETLQKLVDDFCATIPFHLGNRTHAQYFDDPSVEYPYSIRDPHRNKENAKQSTALGGWFIIGPLRGIMSTTAPKSSLQPPLLRPGQFAWLLQTVFRIAALYQIRIGPDAAPNMPAKIIAPENIIKEDELQRVTWLGEGVDPA